jgi:nucleoside-diphosphate-sugar epimerase
MNGMAVAKIAGIKLVEADRRQYGADFISVMPTNLYGPGDNYHPEHSHVPAALIRRLHEAKLSDAPTATVWGTGLPRREFLAVDDLADACVFVMKHYSGDVFLNVGVGQEHHDRRIRAARGRCYRLPRAACFRHHAPGRCTAEAPRWVQAGAARLARQRPPAGHSASASGSKSLNNLKSRAGAARQTYQKLRKLAVHIRPYRLC